MSTALCFRTIRTERIGDVTVIRFTSAKIIEDVWIQAMGSELLSLFGIGDRCQLLLDFDGIDFFSSAALGKLMYLALKAARCSVPMKLCSMRPEVLAIFAVTKLIKRGIQRQIPAPGADAQTICESKVTFAYYTDQASALAAFAALDI